MPETARAPLVAADPGPGPPGGRSLGPVLPSLTLTVGGSALRVSRLGLGTHGLHWSSSRARQGLLGLAFDLGVRYFDTAPAYGSGLAEREVGRFAEGRRSKIVISTKFGIPTSRVLSRVPGLLLASRAAAVLGRKVLRASPPMRDYSARAATASLEESLRALRTSYVDVLQLHEPQLSQLCDVDGLLRTLEALKAAGKVRHIGLSGNAAACTAIAQAHPGLAELLQIEVPADAQGLPAAEAVVPGVAVRFWEVPSAARPAALSDVMQRLKRVAPQGVILLSTRQGALLREAVERILGCA